MVFFWSRRWQIDNNVAVDMVGFPQFLFLEKKLLSGTFVTSRLIVMG